MPYATVTRDVLPPPRYDLVRSCAYFNLRNVGTGEINLNGASRLVTYLLLIRTCRTGLVLYVKTKFKARRKVTSERDHEVRSCFCFYTPPGLAE
jgi:hypothetical protein